jgi:hypothetical protein
LKAGDLRGTHWLERFALAFASGRQDGEVTILEPDGDISEPSVQEWQITIGRAETNDFCILSDTFISREHAILEYRDGQWWLNDLGSTNGTYTHNSNDFFNDIRVIAPFPIAIGHLFRVGRTWLMIAPQA